jgi:hypothetical protein
MVSHSDCNSLRDLLHVRHNANRREALPRSRTAMKALGVVCLAVLEPATRA